MLHDDSVREVHPLNIRQRFTLPWKPTDLHDYLIIFTRAHPTRPDEFVEDLRCRRNLVGRALQLLARKGTWRDSRGVESMHLYFNDYDFRAATEIEEILPEDGVPRGSERARYRRT